MEYNGRYGFFDASKIQTYPLVGRQNRVHYDDLVWPDAALAGADRLPPDTAAAIEAVARAMVEARADSRAVICFTGAHLIKNGLGPLLADLIERRLVTLVAGNGATAIHDFELALIGETSETVPNALPKGQFGMAFEFAWIAAALRVGNAGRLGLGESLGRAMRDPDFRASVESACVPRPAARAKLFFRHHEVSVLARAYKCGLPMTIHVGIGTDVLDQHPGFDGEAKGGTSGRDFLIYVNEVGNLAGGVVLNIGSAVTGPEVLLKALSMTANVGRPANGLTTANFDLRPCQPDHLADEKKFGYYFRDQKSVFSRVPEAFGGKGHYIQGNQIETFPSLYRALRKLVG
ncbi:MAG: hypothetical protein QME60_01785 [Verrucomicrobiota bacterium]|nr:hypothetical protein [Verrucomicrobiota bacterium]